MQDKRAEEPQAHIPTDPSEEREADGEHFTKRRRSWWARLLIWLGGIIGALLLVLVVFTALLMIPSVQTRIANKLLVTMERSTGLRMSVERLSVGFPGKLYLEGLQALTADGDTVLYAKRLTAQTDAIAYLRHRDLPLSGVALERAQLDYHAPGDSMVLRGHISRFAVDRGSFDSSFSRMSFGTVELSDTHMDVLILPKEKKEKKEPKSPPPTIRWDKLLLNNVSATYTDSPDSLIIDAHIYDALVSGGLVDLPDSLYTVDRVDLQADLNKVGAPLEMLPSPWGASIRGEAIRYGGADDLTARLREASLSTGDGWQLHRLSGLVTKDRERLRVEELVLELSQSKLGGELDLPFTGWRPDSVGTLSARLAGRICAPELERFVPMAGDLPDLPLRTVVTASGDWQRGVDAEIRLEEPSLLRLHASARATSLLGGGPMTVKGHYELRSGRDLSRQVSQLMKSKKPPRWQIPDGMDLVGSGSYDPNGGEVDLRVTLPEGYLTAVGHYRPGSKSYAADVEAVRFDVGAFLPSDSIGYLDGQIHAKGHGTDLYSARTSADVFLNLDSVEYKGATYRDLVLLTRLEKNRLFAALDSDNEALRATAQMDLLLKKHDLNGSVNLYVDTIIPDRLGLPQSVVRGGRIHLNSYLRSDLDQFYDFEGRTMDFVLQLDNGVLRPQETVVRALSTDSLLRASVESGDLSLAFASKNGLKEFQRRLKDLSQVVSTALRDTTERPDMSRWIEHYPDADLQIDMGRNNPLRYYLDAKRIGARGIHLGLQVDPAKGLRGEGMMQYFQADTFRVDNIDLILRQDSAFVYGMLTAHKERFRNQLPFNAVLSFSSNIRRSEVALDWQDHEDRHFLTLGAELYNKPSGELVFGFTPTPIVLAYNTFVPKAENYFIIPPNKGKIRADIDLRSEDGAVISLKDLPGEGRQELQGVIRDLKLSALEGIPVIPHLEGVLSADVRHITPDGGQPSITARASLRDFIYEDKKVGDLALRGSAEPDKKGQMIRAEADLGERERVVDLLAFLPKGSDDKRFDLRIDHLPLEMLNPFLPDQYAEAHGELSGEVANYLTTGDIRTSRALPYRGEIAFHQGEVYVPALNETYRVENQRLPIADGELLFRRFALGANGGQLIVNGKVGLADAFPLNLNIIGSNLRLLDSEETSSTMLYGRINADTRLQVSGHPSDLTARGRLSILGNTNFTYRTPKSQLSGRSGYKDLVTFTDFSDTLFVAQTSRLDSISQSGMTLAIDLHVDPAARFTAILSPEEQTKVSVVGGGDLNLDMSPYGPMRLTGTYDIRDGEVVMEIPPVVRTFTIDDNSRLTWSGDLTKPAIDFRATAKVSSRVSLQGEEARPVDFNVSIIAENTLNDLDLRFETTAPKDFALRNRLATLSEEEQTRQSIILLTTGYFFGSNIGSPGNGNSNAMVNNALAGLFTSQVNSFLGESLHADINFGITNDQTAAGERTDYTYSVAKRFFNDRIRVVVGGRVMTGAAAAGMEQSFIDNVSMEYRLDQAGTHYLRLFHNKNYENFLEGEVIETGVGYVLRRRLDSLRDLFRFGRSTDSIPAYADIPSPETLIIEDRSSLRKEAPALSDSLQIERPLPLRKHEDEP